MKKTVLFLVLHHYHLEKEVYDHLRKEGSASKGCSGISRLIWSLNLPNAVKMFLWRACYNILSTKENLLKRGIVKDPFCHFCEIVGESLSHILWNCPSAMDIWGACENTFQKSPCSGFEFLQVVEEMVSRCNSQNFEFFVVYLRKFWLKRNTVVHGGEFLDLTLW
jgi:hypothetical protein